MSPVAIVRMRGRCASAVVNPSVHLVLPRWKANINVVPGAFRSAVRVVVVICRCLLVVPTGTWLDLDAAARTCQPTDRRLHSIYPPRLLTVVLRLRCP